MNDIDFVKFSKRFLEDKSEFKLLPYQEALMLCISKGVIFDPLKARRFSKVITGDILTQVRMMTAKKGNIICIATPNGFVKFECIENEII